MKKIAATLIAGLFATAAFAQTTTASAAPTAMPAAGQDKQDGGSDAKDSPVAHKATTKHTAKKHTSTKAKAKMPADAQGTTAGSVSNGAVEAGTAAPASK
jgi:hypothetical protein